MLPPGARVYLEVTSTVGWGNHPNQINRGPGAIWTKLGASLNFGTLLAPQVQTGAWIGDVKCSFEIETADGTAHTTNVNILGNDEG